MPVFVDAHPIYKFLSASIVKNIFAGRGSLISAYINSISNLFISLKENVDSVTVVEANDKTIEVFNKYIFPKFKFKNKINIIKADAYEYIKNMPKYDYIFVDIYHDAKDGLECYNRMIKNDNIKNANVDFWIYNTIKHYIK